MSSIELGQKFSCDICEKEMISKSVVPHGWYRINLQAVDPDKPKQLRYFGDYDVCELCYNYGKCRTNQEVLSERKNLFQKLWKR